MNSVERLHIDELKRVERKANTLLKSWRRLQKEYQTLIEKHILLNETLEKANSDHEAASAKQESAHQAALEALEKQWQSRYQQETESLKAAMAQLESAQQQTLARLESEHHEQVQTLQQQLTAAQQVKAAMIARIRGVEHE